MEGDATVTVCVRLSGPIEREVIMELTSSPLTADDTTGIYLAALFAAWHHLNYYTTDYSPPDGNFTFITSVSLCVDVTIRDDSVLESTELFQISVASSDPDVSLNVSTTFVSISDNDRM